VIENAGEGTEDTVSTTLAVYVLAANVEELIFNTAVNAVGTGNALDNSISGNLGNDKLDGAGGNDFIQGAEGNDTLIGGEGVDQLSGGNNNDSLDGGNGGDQLAGGSGDDTLTGGAGNDELDGEAGDDLLIGGAGDDEYTVDSSGDKVQEAANNGIDSIATFISLTLAVNIENAYSVIGGLSVSGNGLNNVMHGSTGGDDILGADGNDTLFGNDGGDALGGGDGNDVIEGGLQADLLGGGAGNDLFLYRLDNIADLAQLGGDTISGFEVGKDTIDLYDLFSDFGIVSADVVGDGYLEFQVVGGDTNIRFDSNGGGNSFVTLVTLDNVTTATLADIILPQGGLPT
jgi:Ca2+-binding RTX toxin-like protein